MDEDITLELDMPPEIVMDIFPTIAADAPVKSVNSKIGHVVLNAADVGLGLVDNTSDADKPISIATQVALDAKAETAYVDAQDSTLSSVISSLNARTSSVDNTADLAKPVSVPQKTYIDNQDASITALLQAYADSVGTGKVSKAGDTMTGLLTLSTAANMGLRFGSGADGYLRVSSSSGVRIFNDSATADMRLVPAGNSVYIQNTDAAGNVIISGPSAALLAGALVYQGTGAIRPSSNLGARLGTESFYWSNGHIQRLYLNSTAYIAGSTPGLVSLVGNLGISGAISGIGNDGIYSGSNSGLLRLSGGSVNDGAVIVMGGSTGSSIPNQGILRIGATNILTWTPTGVIPGSNLGFDNGSASFYWNNMFARRINLNSSVYIDGATNGVATVNGQLSVNSTFSSVGVVTNLGLNRVNSKNSVSAAPLIISRLSVSNRGTFDAISAYAGEGDIFYCLDRNPDYTITSNYAAGSYRNLFNGDMSSDIAVPVANLATTPWVLTITKNSGFIDFTDVDMLRLVGHRLGANGATLTDWKVETRGTDGNWYTELNRTGVSDVIDQLAVPLHVTGQSYPDGFPTYHQFSGIRITVSGATEANFSPGNLSFAAVMLTNTRPAMSAARGLGALDMRGGRMFGYTEWLSGKVAFTPSEAGAASVRIPAGVAPSSPANGDVWFDGSALKICIGGVTKTVTVT